MIKYFCMFLISFIGFIGCVFSQDLSNKQKDGLCGQVKQVTLVLERFSDVAVGWTKEGKDIVTIYDVEGHRIFETASDLENLGCCPLTIRMAAAVSNFDFEKKGQTVIKETKDKEGKTIETRVFIYDTYGFCTNFTLYNKKEFKKEKLFEYEYDFYGNWVKQTEYLFSNQENAYLPVARYTRNIVYY